MKKGELIYGNSLKKDFFHWLEKIFEARGSLNKSDFVRFMVREFDLTESLSATVFDKLGDRKHRCCFLDLPSNSSYEIFSQMGICFKGGEVPCNLIPCIILRKVLGEEFFFEIINGKIVVKKAPSDSLGHIPLVCLVHGLPRQVQAF